MMMILLAKRRPCSLVPSPHIHPLLPRFFSSSSTQNSDPKTPKFIVTDYLTATLGFSTDKAARVSRLIAHLKSPEKPDSVLRFLKDHGFSDSHINRLIAARPGLLCSDPVKALDPNLRALRDMGLSTSTVTQIIISDPLALRNPLTLSRINFWLDFLGDQAALAKAFMSNRSLGDYDISQNIVPKLTLLQSHGFSTQEIRRIVCSVSQFITSRISGMEDLLNRTKELGFQPVSGMFLKGLQIMVCNTRDRLEKKMELLKSFGWSEDELLSALLKAPHMLIPSDDNLQSKMDFLLREPRCDSSYIKSHPILLTYCLEKRLRPRNNVLHLLETKGLSAKGHWGFTNAIKLTNNQFVERYIIPHKEEISGLHETYLAAVLGKQNH